MSRRHAGASRPWNSCSRANCTVDREDNTMTTLTVYSDCEPGTALGVYTDFTAIRDQLAAIGVEFQRWETNQPLSANAGQDEVIAAYQNEIDALNARYGSVSIDVVSIRSEEHTSELQSLLRISYA